MNKRLMSYLIVFIAILILCGCPAETFATTVSGTFQDPNGQTLNIGSVTAVLVGPNGSTQGPFYVSGTQLTPAQTNITTALNGSGVYSQALTSNTTITPVNSQWAFTVCPNSTSPCTSNIRVTISGGSQSISTEVNAQLAAIVVSPVQQPKAYTDAEVINPITGSNYFNLVSNVSRQYYSGAWHNWAGSGGGGCTPAGLIGNALYDDGAGACSSSTGLTLGAGSITAMVIANGTPLNWADTGISRTAAGVMAFGNGTQGDFSGTIKATTINAVTSFQVNGVALASTNLTDTANLVRITQDATFGAHTYDMSAVTLFKTKVSAGYTGTANGVFGYDSTANNYHGYNGADEIFPLVAVGTATNGQCVTWIVSGSKVTQGSAACASGPTLAANQTWTGTNTFTPATDIAAIDINCNASTSTNALRVRDASANVLLQVPCDSFGKPMSFTAIASPGSHSAGNYYIHSSDFLWVVDNGTLFQAGLWFDIAAPITSGGLIKQSSTAGKAVVAVAGTDYVSPIFAGTVTINPTSISANSCATVITAAASGVASTDTIQFTPNASIKAVVGYRPADAVTIVAYPTTNTLNFDVCNKDQTNAIDPDSITLNAKVTR